MSEQLQRYLKQKIAEIDQQKDIREIMFKGRLSFGMDAQTYSHLPAWNDLVQRKKRLVRWLWADAFFLSLFIVSASTDVWDKFGQNWLKALAGLLLLSLVIMLFFVIITLYNVFVQFRQVDRQARKLIYQDILYRLQQEKELV